jgi:hypothetical protein
LGWGLLDGIRVMHWFIIVSLRGFDLKGFLQAAVRMIFLNDGIYFRVGIKEALFLEYGIGQWGA